MAKTFWEDRAVFVTGCTGLLGSWMTKALVGSGARVVGLVRDQVPDSLLVQEGLEAQITVVRGSVEEYALLERILNEYEVETVFHLAAQTIVTIANRNPLSTFESNIRGTWNVLEACRRVPAVRQVLVASSDKAYGTQPHLPYDETMPLQGRHFYDVSKSCADLLSASYFEMAQLPVCIMRCGNFYGGGDLNFNRIVPQTIRAALRNAAPVIRSDGSYVRDWIYIEDAVAAYVLLAERMAEQPKLLGEAFNFSNEMQMTVLRITEELLRVMSRTDLRPRILNEPLKEIRHQFLNAGKAHRLLGWQPRFSLEEGLQRTVAWYQRYFARHQELLSVEPTGTVEATEV
ncbi:MAG: GDP-mannose 4,6-dehydratase [Candidatus Omnitrophica bacterium]|nr:GDP-mannose 4,6-dehydratase [Candidatus Omnitrophota bacterium]